MHELDRADLLPDLQTPTRLLSALENAKERTLMAPAAFSCVLCVPFAPPLFISDFFPPSSSVTSSNQHISPVAFSISATRLQVTSFLAKEGIANPSVAREVLLEYVARKERIVSAWPGGVRASIEVVQGGLRDVWIEASSVFHRLQSLKKPKLIRLDASYPSSSEPLLSPTSLSRFSSRPVISPSLSSWASSDRSPRRQRPRHQRGSSRRGRSPGSRRRSRTGRMQACWEAVGDMKWESSWRRLRSR